MQCDVQNADGVEKVAMIKSVLFAREHVASLLAPDGPRTQGGEVVAWRARHPFTRSAELDDEIYQRFRAWLPDLNVNVLQGPDDDPYGANGTYTDREYWGPLSNRFCDRVPDRTLLTLLRLDPTRSYDEPANVLLVPRFKFYAIELAREREGITDPQQVRQLVQSAAAAPVATAAAGATSGGSTVSASGSVAVHGDAGIATPWMTSSLERLGLAFRATNTFSVLAPSSDATAGQRLLQGKEKEKEKGVVTAPKAHLATPVRMEARMREIKGVDDYDEDVELMKELRWLRAQVRGQSAREGARAAPPAELALGTEDNPYADVFHNDDAEIAGRLAQERAKLLSVARAGARAIGGCGMGADAPIDATVERELLQQAVSVRLSEITTEVGRRRQAAAALPPAACASGSALSAVSDDAVRELAVRGLTCIDGALPADTAGALAAELRDLAARPGAMRQTFQARVGTRTDRIRWLGQDDASEMGLPVLARAVQMMRGLAHAIQEKWPAPAAAAAAAGGGAAATAPELRVPEQCMVAVYDAGARYVAHRDNVPWSGGTPAQPTPAVPVTAQDNGRAVTAILYCNEPGEWKTEWGGQLRAYPGVAADVCDAPADGDGDGDGSASCEFAPIGGRLVLFRSRELLHEVLPAQRHRVALSIWILGDNW